MSVKVMDIIDYIEKLAPKNLAEPWDNPGLMVGNACNKVKKVLFSLDCSEKVIDEAIEIGADMIITHHPMIFKGIKSIDFNSAIGRKIFKAIKNDITVYSAHTNLDIADGGTNTVLADLIDLQDIQPLLRLSNDTSIGKCGMLKEQIRFSEFVNELKLKLNAKTLNINGNLDTIIRKVGLCTGKSSSAEYLCAAKNNNCDLYITGDVGYHDAQIAEELGICLVDGTHYLTEVIVMPKLSEYVSQRFTDIECVCSNINGQTLIAY